MKVEKVDESRPVRRCVTCGERIEAEDFDALWAKYTDHQVREHDKPSMGGESTSGPGSRLNYRLTFKCAECGNENPCETAVDWDNPPVACNECGERDWERVDREVLA